MILGLDFSLVAIDTRTETDEGGVAYTAKHGLYVNKEHKKSILLSQYRYKGEPDFYKVEEVLSSIPGENYEALVKSITENPTPSAICISQVYGTTADYKVVYREYFEDINGVIHFFKGVKEDLKGTPGEYLKYLFTL